MTTTPAASMRPTHVRYRVLFICFLSAVLLYLDRFCMNFAQQYVKEDLGLSEDQLGYCMSAFFFAYALFQVPSGWLTDRFGPRATLTLYILIWSLFTALMGAVMGFLGLLVVRMAAGVGQAGAYPTCASVVRRWMSTAARGRASSVIAFGGRVGGAIAPLLTAWLVIAFVPLDVDPLLQVSDTLSLSELESIQSGAAIANAQGNPEVIHRIQLAQDILEQIPAAARQEPSVLVDSFNQLISGPILTAGEEMSGLGLEKEAVRYLAAEELNDTQRLRLNRLILEAIFPGTIKKLYVHGWRSVMLVYGLIGIPVALLFWWIVRDTPDAHPRTNQAERNLPPPQQPSDTGTAQDDRFPVEKVLRSRSLWLMSISQFLAVLGWTFLVTWLPRYLLEVHQVPFETRGLMISVPLWCGWFGMLFGGWVTDRLSDRLGLKWGRALPIGVGRTCAGCCFLFVAVVHPQAWGAVLAFSLVAIFTDSGSSAVWAVHQDIGGKFTASVLGWGNMWGNFGSAVSPLLLQRLLEQSGDWDDAFLACSGCFLVSGVMALFIDVRDKISD